jgi:hypothetical protein
MADPVIKNVVKNSFLPAMLLNNAPALTEFIDGQRCQERGIPGFSGA